MTFSNTKAPPPITLDSLHATIKALKLANRPIGKAIYVRSDAWPALRRELEARCLVHDTRTSAGRTIPTGRVAGLLGIDIFVTEMPIPKPWAWDFELGIKP